MLYLLWGLLNLGLIIYFLFICFKAIKLIRERIGIGAAVVFVVGILSLSSAANEPDSNHKIKSWDFVPSDSVSMLGDHLVSVKLEMTLVPSFELNIQYHTNEVSHTNTPVSATSTFLGFESGVQWKPDVINVTKTSDPTKLAYSVLGVVDWKLFGTTLYTQTKTYTGTASTKDGAF